MLVLWVFYSLVHLCLENLFYMYKKLQIIQIKNSISLCLRKKYTENVSELDLLNNSFVNRLIQHDDGYNILRDVRLSCAYWKRKNKLSFLLSQPQKQIGLNY
jgi:hypothetical protein